MTTKQNDLLNRHGRIASVSSGSSVVSFDYAYNAANQRVQANREDGAYWRYEYDKLGQVVSGKKYWSDGTPVPGMQFEYGFDDIGNRKSTKAGGNRSGAGLRPATYGANSLNQYTNRIVPGAFDVLGAAHAQHNVTVNGSPTDYRHGEFFRRVVTPNNTNAAVWQSVSVINSATSTEESGHVFLPQTPETFTYDADGNLLSDGRWDYTWDAENRLIAMETRSAAYTAGAPRQKLEFTYDWQSRRISKTVSNLVSGTWQLVSDQRFLYDGWNLLAILDDQSSLLQTFTWGLDLSGSEQGAGGVGGLLWVGDYASVFDYFAPAYDGNGNVMALVSLTDGSTTGRYEYGPFGEQMVVAGAYAEASPFRFSTKFMDEETGHLYYGYRYYMAGMGRWLSRDPVEEKGGEASYRFAANGPIALADVLGLWVQGDWCQTAKELGFAWGKAGGIICVRGKKIACVWDPRGTSTNPLTNPTARAAAIRCAWRHEESHFPEGDCPCDDNPLPTPFQRREPEKWRNYECKAYEAHLDCLMNALVVEGVCKSDNECRDQLEKVLFAADAMLREMCGRPSSGR